MAERGDCERPIADWLTEVASDEILVVPLVGKVEVLGALALDNRSGGRRFGADDRTLLDGLATQAVIAIENARVVRDLRHSREHVRRADRLGTLGTLAAGLAHEINNPLVSIHTFLSLAPEKREQDDDDFWVDYHSLASGELERIRGLVATMSKLGQGSGETVAPEPVELAALVEEVVALVRREARAEHIQLRVECESSSHVDGVRNHLHQVILNLLLNAVHATPEGGEVRVRVEGAKGSDGEVCLTVEDTGSGVPPEDLERIFDPFFTTKGPDEGTGLGLMISHRIVSDHGGSIEVRSRLGEGSIFRVRLPALRDHDSPGHAESAFADGANDADLERSL
jgi:signal transduction histidine kinase